MVYKFFDKKTLDGAAKGEFIPNRQFAEELYKPIIRTFEKRNVHSSFIGNIWGGDLADMQLISKFNQAIYFLLSVIDFYSKYVWVAPLKDKNGITITIAFQQILDSYTNINQTNHKGSEFYNRLQKSWLQDNDIEMYLTHNKGKSIIAEI